MNELERIQLYKTAWKHWGGEEKVDFTIDDVGDWINEDISIVGRVMAIFQEQMPRLKNQEAPGKGA